MKIEKVAKIKGGQDGAIYGSELFRFTPSGECYVYDMRKLVGGAEVVSAEPIAKFKLDRSDEIAPHSNAVSFGCEFFEEGDEYPLLYTNIYNNYADGEDKLIGVCLVYRIRRCENVFTSTLLQMIEIGFCEDAELWRASVESHGTRPYGNFLVDRDTRSYWAFVMRNPELGTRYFRFDLPRAADGVADARYGVRRVTLGKDDIKEYFDCSYHHYIQGAALSSGKIYSTEGFDNAIDPPAIRVIDLARGEETYFDIMSLGFTEEAEFIDFYNGRCFYSDLGGNLYSVEF